MEALGQIASRRMASVSPDAGAKDAVRLMVERRISCLVVVVQSTPVGVLGERDVVCAANQIIGFPDLTVGEVMTGPVPTVSADTPVNRAIRYFRRQGTRYLILTDENLELAGVVTLSDVVHKLSSGIFDQVADLAALMTVEVRTIRPDVSVRTAINEMSRQDVGCLVVEKSGRAVGIFTERDVLRVLAGGPDIEKIRLEDVMSRPVETVSSSMKPSEAIARMRESGVRRLVAADDRGRIIGLVTQSDLAWLAEWVPEDGDLSSPPAA